MTFYFGMLVVVPGEEAIDSGGFPPGRTEKRTVWRIEQMLDLSDINTDFESIKFRAQNKKNRARAYFLDLLQPEFMKYVENGDISFAPKFVLYPDDVKHLLDEKEFVFPLGGGHLQKPVPTHFFMDTHNDALKRGFRPHGLEGLCDTAAPFMWVECGRVYEMLSLGSERTRTLAVGDAEAQCFLNIWEHMLCKFDQMKGRVIFLFGPAALESLSDDW